MTHNNEDTIGRCVQSFLGICDELIIIDDMSTDKTVDVVKRAFPAAKVYSRKLNYDFATQRNFGLSKAKNEWVLFIDSDESLTPALADQITEELRSPRYDAYLSRRDNQVMNMFFPRNSGRPILLKRHLKFKNRLHENIYGVEFGYLKAPLMHYCWKDCNDWVNDINKYSEMNARKWVSEGRTYSRLQILLIGMAFPVFYFFKIYLWEGRWRGGMPALVYCAGCSAEWHFSALKYYEMRFVAKSAKGRTKAWSKTGT